MTLSVNLRLDFAIRRNCGWDPRNKISYEDVFDFGGSEGARSIKNNAYSMAKACRKKPRISIVEDVGPVWRGH